LGDQNYLLSHSMCNTYLVEYVWILTSELSHFLIG
jgi:hypothetical protein